MSLLYNNDTQVANYVKKIDWKKVAIVAVAAVAATAVTIATAGAAGPLIAAGVSGLGLSGAAATVVTAAAVGGVAGAAGGAVSGFTTSVLSGDKPKDVLMNTLGGAWNGLKSGAMTGGLLGGFGAATSSVSGPVARYAVDTFGETAVDTIVDVAQGGKVTPGSVMTSLAINATTEGISARGAKGTKADVNTSKPKGRDVSTRKAPKDTTSLQRLSKPGPNKSRTPVQAVDGNGNKVYGELLEPGYTHKKPVKDVTPNASTPQKRISGLEPNAPRLEAPSSNTAQINPHNIRFSQNSVNGADAIQSSMAKSGWKGDAIDVVNMPDGQLTTIDNTRVIAARGAGIDVTARVHQHADSLPDEFIDRFTTRAGTPSTWGEAVQLRVGKQKSSFRTGNPYGSYDLERRN